MATFLLIRHASVDAIGRVICGRKPGIHLNNQGRDEAEALADSLRGLPIASIYTGPLERTRETAAPLVSRLRLVMRECDALNEVDFGEWSGYSYEELAGIPEWKQFNSLRSVNHPPGGESMLQVQTRIVGLMEGLSRLHEKRLVAMFTHGDVIRAALVHYLGMPLDLFQRLEAAPASISAVEREGPAIRVLRINQRNLVCDFA